MIEKLNLDKYNNIQSATDNFKMIENKINEIIEHLNNQKQSFSSLYGIPMKDFIKKEDLKKYLERNINKVKDKIEKNDDMDIDMFYRGYKYCLEIIKFNFSL